MKIKISDFDLKLVYPFAISRHTYYTQQNVVIELEHNGYLGYGEATVNPYYGITIENLRSTLSGIKSRLNNYNFSNPGRLYNDFSDLLPQNSFALAALNNASWDIYGKMQGKPVSDLLELSKGDIPMTSYTLGIDTLPKMLKKLKDKSWPIYKIKLGTDDDIELVKFLRDQTTSAIRVDANCAWNAEETVEKSKKLMELDVEFIEQPLPKDNKNQKFCFEESALPLMADESCCQETDVDKCYGNFHGINIKLLKCGGITPAVRMIKKARALGLKVMIGCMTETTIGISTASQVLPFVDFADLDGPLLLAEDLAEGLIFQNGYIKNSGKPGLGIKFIGQG